MFGNLFSSDPEKADLANRSIAIQLTTLNIALLDKGLISEAEFEQYRVQATHLVEQLWAEQQNESEQLNTDEHLGILHVKEIASGKDGERESPADDV